MILQASLAVGRAAASCCTQAVIKSSMTWGHWWGTRVGCRKPLRGISWVAISHSTTPKLYMSTCARTAPKSMVLVALGKLWPTSDRQDQLIVVAAADSLTGLDAAGPACKNYIVVEVLGSRRLHRALHDYASIMLSVF